MNISPILRQLSLCLVIAVALIGIVLMAKDSRPSDLGQQIGGQIRAFNK